MNTLISLQYIHLYLQAGSLNFSTETERILQQNILLGDGTEP